MTSELAVVPLASSPGLPSPASSVSVPAFSSPDLRDVVWGDISESPDGEAVGVFGNLWSELSAKQLRTVASRLSIKGIKNAKKGIIIEKLQHTRRNKKTYSGLQRQQKEKDKAVRKEVQCPFRLINLLFSDQFAGEFAMLGNVANRQLLDTGRAANDEHFWVSVRRAFIEPGNAVFDNLAFCDTDNVFADVDHINPSKIVKHEWKKLRTIWKAVNAEYKATLSRFVISGTHESSFFDFCNGNLATYYLRKHLDAKPQLNETVEADLPAECGLSSELAVPDELAKNSASSMASKITNSDGNRRKKGSPNEVADAIREFTP